ncbi:MAG: hypothetical protein CMF38_01900 [Legionellaceae bacterium]|nr:hypothetical protein [Legionellaceae bacterium]
MSKDTFFPLPCPNLDNLAESRRVSTYDFKARQEMYKDAMSHEGEACIEPLQEFIDSEKVYLQASGRVRSLLLDRAIRELHTLQNAENPPEFCL